MIRSLQFDEVNVLQLTVRTKPVSKIKLKNLYLKYDLTDTLIYALKA